jgi:hypothetical protein
MEELKANPGYPKYKISPKGKVISFWYKTPHEVKPQILSSGYLVVSL